MRTINITTVDCKKYSSRTGKFTM